MSSCVLDTDVVIGALDDADAHHRRAATLIHRLVDGGVLLMVSVVNYTEALVKPATEPATFRRAVEAIADMGIDVMPADDAIGREAARLRHRRLSLGDGFALATALRLRSSLATFDERLRNVARESGLAVV